MTTNRDDVAKVIFLTREGAVVDPFGKWTIVVDFHGDALELVLGRNIPVAFTALKKMRADEAAVAEADRLLEFERNPAKIAEGPDA